MPCKVNDIIEMWIYLMIGNENFQGFVISLLAMFLLNTNQGSLECYIKDLRC